MTAAVVRPIVRPATRAATRHAVRQAAGAQPATLATWDAASASPVISLDGTSLIATTSGNDVWATVRGNIGRSAGKGNVQIQFPGSESNTLQFIGICNASAGTEGMFVGYDSNGWGIFASDGSKWTNLSSSAFGSPWNIEAMQIEADFDAKTANIFAGSTLLDVLDFSSITGPYYFAGSLYVLNRTAVVNAGQTAMSRAPSVGYPGTWGPDA